MSRRAAQVDYAEIDRVVQGVRDALSDDYVLTLNIDEYANRESAFGFRGSTLEHYKYRLRELLRKRQYEIKLARRTPEEVEADNLKRVDYVAREFEQRDTLDRFLIRVVADPADAFEWAERPLEEAARLHVAARLRNALEQKLPFADIQQEVHKRVIEGARYPSRSTSAVSNLMKTNITAAWAQAWEYLK